MINKRIVETLQNIFRKLLQFFFRQVQGFHQLIEHNFMNVFTYHFMLASLAHNVDSRQISYRRQHCVRTVQQSNFSFVIRSFRRNEQYIQTGFVGREFLGDLLRSFNYPQMEDFCLYHQIVIILQFFFNSSDIFAGESRHNTVYQSSIDTTSFLKPLLEVFTQVPQINILIDGFFQFMAVQENQFARENYQTFALVTIERFITVIQQLGQFARIR